MRLHHCSPLAALVLATGCFIFDQGTPSSPDEIALNLRPGTSKVMEGSNNRWDPQAPPWNRPGSYPLLGDVVRDGTRILVSGGTSVRNGWGGDPFVLVSDDEGATWTSHKFPAPWFQSSPELVNGVFGLHASNGEVVHTANLWRDGALGMRWDYIQFMHVELSTNQWLTPPDDESRRSFIGLGAVGDRLVSYGYAGDPRAPTHGTLQFFEAPLATRAAPTLSLRSFEVTGCMPARWATRDGMTFVGFCERTVPTAQVCKAIANPRFNLEPQFECIPKMYWPDFLGTTGIPVVTNRGIRWLIESGERTFAVDVDAVARRADVVDLGPGRVVPHFVSLQPRLGNLLAIGTSIDSKDVRILDLTATGLDEIRLPRTPCVSASSCGAKAGILEMLPLGGDDYFVFYSVNTVPEERGTHAFIYARRETIQRSASNVGGPVVIPPLPQYPEALPATPLEKACALARACFPIMRPTGGRPSELASCEQYWTHVRGTMTRDPGYEKFVATPAGDCDAVFQNWPLLQHFWTKGCLVGKCSGSMLVSGCVNAGGTASPTPADLTVSQGIDCAAYGLTCREINIYTDASCLPETYWGPPWPPVCNKCEANGNVFACKSGSSQWGTGLLLDCAALEGTCAAGTATLTELGQVGAFCGSGSCSGSAPRCIGNVVSSCVGGKVVPVDDCARLGNVCSNGACVAPARSPNCPPAASCQGESIIACVDGLVHHLDCTSIGFTGCAMEGGRASCTR